jgi:hypothetical protein
MLKDAQLRPSGERTLAAMQNIAVKRRCSDLLGMWGVAHVEHGIANSSRAFQWHPHGTSPFRAGKKHRVSTASAHNVDAHGPCGANN